MLHPKNDRIDYGEQLIPPEGYELTQAIGTSYSLDLEALMLVPVALFYAHHLDGNPDTPGYDMLEAITKAAEKITIFYQAGQLKVPRKYHPLIAYWEKGIQPVTMPNPVSSFHPKVWIIRYDSKTEPAIYRLLVTSRNLTFDRSWDVAFSTMGFVSDKQQASNQPLVDLLTHLSGLSKRSIPPSFLSDLQKVVFEKPEGIKAIKFWPVGIPNVADANKKYSNQVTQKKWDELLIISPFLDNTTLTTLKDNCYKKPYLLSCKESLDAVKETVLADFDCWQFSDFIQNAEFADILEEEGVEPCLQNLHAKLFVAMQNDKPVWYLGSANCTDPAQGRNIEFMAELVTDGSTKFRSKNVFKSLTEPAKEGEIQLFTKYDPALRVDMSEQVNIDLAIRKIKYDLTTLNIRGEAVIIPEGNAYNLTIEIDASGLKLPDGFSVHFKPLPETQKKPAILGVGQLNINNDFTGYTESWLSPYLEFSIARDGIVYTHFLLEMSIELPGTRLNRIFTSIIDSKEKFLKYLAFVLTGEESGIIGSGKSDGHDRAAGDGGILGLDGAPVFEKLLIAASRHREKLVSVDKLIDRIKEETELTGDRIVTEEFEGFWKVFKDYLITKK
ncbi:MAG: phospholipase D family protein [Opitutaceae bacterium]|nr:phospholipase D family protein [Cytophagales bacterium]